ncbi:ABC transporter ATP-binding protein [Acuticoccus sediminis]|uniref:ABC transporter ATP-binding protein n=1 Tax=Acuticoccus sediminis TaxID=2184697 RepID=A0A8B2P0E7_9HYPH|nr:oligopeptide/dipeptide ABC transporter ATP-binding protein [Acuticoccus sediminis]RAI04541.1 ABC transporter ATP-binding protein [Acuticoccus sediminis]
MFDVSAPWLDRVVNFQKKQLLQAVSDVSFEIRHGETFALVGESGSGKSTIAKIVVGLLSATRGEVVVEGVPVGRDSAALRQLRRRMQMIFQDPYASLNPRMRVDRIIAEPIRAFGRAKGRSVPELVAEILTGVGLDPRDGQKFPHEFSGGQRQRICIARAMASSPTFLVCDEPTSALDVSVQAQILNLMRDLQDAEDLTYLFISHDLAVVRHMATRIGVLYLGRLAEVAPAKGLFETPRHPYTQMLLGAVPDLDMSGRERVPVVGEIANPISPPPGCAFHPRCPLANERCRVERPELLAAGPGMAACHAVEEGRA